MHFNLKVTFRCIVISSIALIGAGCGAEADSDDSYRYSSSITDDATGMPVQGATVSLGGIEAESPTNSDGEFTVVGLDTNYECQTLTVNATGFAPFSIPIDIFEETLTGCDTPSVDSKSLASFSVKPLGKIEGGVAKLNQLSSPSTLEIAIPAADSIWVNSSSCTANAIEVKGSVQLAKKDSFLHDVVIVIDTSGSTGETSGLDIDEDGLDDTVLDASVIAAEALVETLKASKARVGIVKFARYNEKNAASGEISDGEVVTAQSRVVVAPTSSWGLINNALRTVASEGSQGGTDTSAGINLAIESLVEAGDRTVGNVTVTPQKSIVLITDGVPTLPIEPGETQQHGDRTAAINVASAARLAGVKIFPVVIETVAEADRKLTTMPAVKATSGAPGNITRVALDELNTLSDLVSAIPLSGVANLDVTNSATANTTPVAVNADGTFSGLVASATGENTLTFTSHSGLLGNSLSASVTVDIYAGSSELNIQQLITNDTPVSSMTEISLPNGTPVEGSGLLDALTRNVPNAQYLSNSNRLSASGTVSINVIYDSAGYASDVGYFTFDPDSPPSQDDVADIMATMTAANIMFNTTGLQGDVDSINVDIEIPEGTLAIGFFIIPNGTLEEYSEEANQFSPLFTLASMNPSSFPQVLTFYDSINGNTIFAWEDISQTFNYSDRDFADIVFSVSSLTSSAQVSECIDGQ